jgi:hypothetical protein
MGIMGGLSGENILQDLDMNTVDLFLHFFTIEQLVNDLHVLDLNVRELILLKAAVLQEVSLMLRQETERTRVQRRVRDVVRVLRPETSGA